MYLIFMFIYLLFEDFFSKKKKKKIEHIRNIFVYICICMYIIL